MPTTTSTTAAEYTIGDGARTLKRVGGMLLHEASSHDRGGRWRVMQASATMLDATSDRGVSMRWLLHADGWRAYMFIADEARCDDGDWEPVAVTLNPRPGAPDLTDRATFLLAVDELRERSDREWRALSEWWDANAGQWPRTAQNAGVLEQSLYNTREVTDG